MAYRSESFPDTVPPSEISYTVRGKEYCACDTPAVIGGRCQECHDEAMTGFNIRKRKKDTICPRCAIYPKKRHTGICYRCEQKSRGQIRGVGKGNNPNGSGRIDDLPKEEIIELYLDGLSPREIAATIQTHLVSGATIANRLREWKVRREDG